MFREHHQHCCGFDRRCQCIFAAWRQVICRDRRQCNRSSQSQAVNNSDQEFERRGNDIRSASFAPAKAGIPSGCQTASTQLNPGIPGWSAINARGDSEWVVWDDLCERENAAPPSVFAAESLRQQPHKLAGKLNRKRESVETTLACFYGIQRNGEKREN